MQAGAPPLNISHHIRKLSFGPAFPGAINPLDGFVRTTTDAAREGTWKYYLKVRILLRRVGVALLHG
jgi:hypothetical protein